MPRRGRRRRQGRRCHHRAPGREDRLPAPRQPRPHPGHRRGPGRPDEVRQPGQPGGYPGPHRRRHRRPPRPASRLPWPGPAVLNVLRVTGGPLGSVPGTSGGCWTATCPGTRRAPDRSANRPVGATAAAGDRYLADHGAAEGGGREWRAVPSAPLTSPRVLGSACSAARPLRSPRATALGAASRFRLAPASAPRAASRPAPRRQSRCRRRAPNRRSRSGGSPRCCSATWWASRRCRRHGPRGGPRAAVARTSTQCRMVDRPLRRRGREVHRRRGDGGVGRAGRARGRRRAGGARRAGPGRDGRGARRRRSARRAWRMRVGVVTGEVAVTVGATAEGMVAGDAVNTAARVQSAAAPGQVWVDETTRALTVGGHHVRRRRRARAQGQGRAGAAVARPASWSPRVGGGAAGRRAGGAAHRARRATCAWSRSCSTRTEESRPPAAGRPRRRGRGRQVPAGLGVREVRRRADRHRRGGTAAAACPTATASRSGRSPRRCAPGSGWSRPTPATS